MIHLYHPWVSQLLWKSALAATTHKKITLQPSYEKSLPGFPPSPQLPLSSTAMTTWISSNDSRKHPVPLSHRHCPRKQVFLAHFLQNTTLPTTLTELSKKLHSWWADGRRLRSTAPIATAPALPRATQPAPPTCKSSRPWTLRLRVPPWPTRCRSRSDESTLAVDQRDDYRSDRSQPHHDRLARTMQILQPASDGD